MNSDLRNIALGCVGSLVATFLAWAYIKFRDHCRTVKIAEGMKKALQDVAGGGWESTAKTFSIQIYNSTDYSVFIRAVVLTALAENGASTDFPCAYGGEHSPMRTDWVELPPKKGDFWSSSLPLECEILGGHLVYDFMSVFGIRRVERVELSRAQIVQLMQLRRTANRSQIVPKGVIPVIAGASIKSDE
ncbi:MAG: hypothetical protein JNM99_16470 [Verrucomicrobiaceae bacterium]|nr:hypothetical protein [Verrucomicrobiaceae bacterium]